MTPARALRRDRRKRDAPAAHQSTREDSGPAAHQGRARTPVLQRTLCMYVSLMWLEGFLKPGEGWLSRCHMMLSALRRVARPAAARSFAAYTPARTWQVYLSGEIHSDWREVIAAGVADRKLPVELGAPITSHEDSDDCGAVILGDEASRPNYDGKGARLNLIRARTGRQARATFPTSQAPSSTVVRSFRLILGRAIISRSALDAWMFLERARAERSKRTRSARCPPGTRTLIDAADVVVVRFGDKYRQWNAAFDAGYATARGKALVTLHPPGVSHMLKEVGRKRRKRRELRTSGRIGAVSARVRTSRVRSPSARRRATRIDARASARVEVGPERSVPPRSTRARSRSARTRRRSSTRGAAASPGPAGRDRRRAPLGPRLRRHRRAAGAARRRRVRAHDGARGAGQPEPVSGRRGGDRKSPPRRASSGSEPGRRSGRAYMPCLPSPCRKTRAWRLPNWL